MMKQFITNRIKAILCFLLLSSYPILAQQASLVKNVDGTANDGSGYFNNGIFLVNDSVILFPGSSFLPGNELFRSNGTNSGTYLTKDIYPGTNSCWIGLSANRAFSNGKQLFFQAQEPGDGFELWTSDGTLTGTFKLKDFNPTTAANSNPQQFTSPDNKKVFFNATVNGVLKTCISDGTSAGTDSTSINAAELPNLYCNGYYYYTKKHPSSIYSNDIWKLDTASLQGQFVYDTDSVNHEGRAVLITVYGDSLILYKAQIDTATHLFTLNVNTLQVTQLPEVHPTYPNLKFHSAFYRIPNSNLVLFSAKSINEGIELWVCDGSSVKLLSDINTGISNGIDQPNIPIPSYIFHNGWVYFSALRDGLGYDIFKTDGTSAATTVAYEFSSFSNAYAAAPICSGAGYLLGGLKTCVGSGCNMFDLYILDNGNATQLLNSNNEAMQVNDNYRYGIEMGGSLYFMAWANTSGREIYKLNGTVTKFDDVEFNNSVQIYPNPTSNNINIKAKSGSKIMLYDMLGNLVIETTINNSSMSLNLQSLPSGLYSLRVNEYSKKIIKY